MNYRPFPRFPRRGGRARSIHRVNYRAAQRRSRCSVTHAAIWARECTCSLRRIFSTCASAVRGATDRRLAMAWLVSPSVTSSATSNSRPVSRGPGLAGSHEAEHRIQDRKPVAVIEQVG